MRAHAFLLVLTPLLLMLQAYPARAQHAAAEYWSALQQSQTPGAVSAVPVPAGLDEKLARGMRHARKYDLTSKRTEAYRGRALLEDVVAARQHDAWGHFALGALLARGPDARQRAHEDALHRFVDEHSLAYGHALRALRRALELDPGHALAAQELIELGLDARDGALVQEGIRAFTARDTSATQHLLLARAAWFRGEVDLTAEAARRAQLAGADAAVAAHLRAAALLQLPERAAEGAEIYLAGLAQPTAAGAAAYWRGLGTIAAPEEVAVWERTPLAERAAWIERFWRLRAARAGVPLPERLAMHFRRVLQADLHYPLRAGMALVGARLAYGVDPRDFGMSMEGLLLVRHGDPFRLRAQNPCRWGVAYYIEREPGGPADDAVDAFVPFADDMAMRMERLGLPPELRLSCRPHAPGVSQAQQRRINRMLAGSDSYVPEVETRLLFATSVYAFRGIDGEADVVAALALPAGAVRALAHGAPMFAADLTFSLYSESARDATVQQMRLRQELPVSLRVPGGPELLSLVQTQLSTPLTGDVSFRAMLRDTTGARAGGWLTGEVHIPSFAGSDPQLSDLMLAPRDARGTWRRGDVALSPAPGKAYPVGEELQLFYELYNVAKDAAYRTEILLAPEAAGVWAAVRRLVRPERNVVHVQFEELARAPHARFGLQELRTLGTPDLDPGTYRVEVRVTDLASRRTATRTRLIEIVAR